MSLLDLPNALASALKTRILGPTQSGERMKVLMWATTFNADLWSVTRSLSLRDDVDVRVVMPDPAIYHASGVAKLFPLGKAQLVKRTLVNDVLGIPGFKPDVTILDNRIPFRATSKKALMLWHGLGWKGPNDRAEFRMLHSQLRRNWGEPLAPNKDFIWSCNGPWDFQHRTQVSGFHPDNCRILGAAAHDDMRVPFDRARAQPFYPFDIVRKRTVLFAPTWHYGEVFAHWGRDAELFERLVTHLGRRDVNIILRLHDSFRFEPAYRSFVSDLARRHPHVMLKFKDHHPDNLIDMQVSDVLLTNYSSIANLFYATGRPTLHIYPVADADEAFTWRTMTVLGVKKTQMQSARFVWRLPPEDHGGLMAKDFETLMAQVDRSLDEPDCCRDATREFLDRHMLGADGHSNERILAALRDLVAA